MEKDSIAKFVDEQIEENVRDLRNVQIKIQQYEQIMFWCLAIYLNSSFSFNFFLTAALNDIFEDTRLDYIAFQKARNNYNKTINYKEFIEDLSICINTSKKLEQIIRKNYAELVMIKEENYNTRVFSTFMFRNLKRFEGLMDVDMFNEILYWLFDDE